MQFSREKEPPSTNTGMMKSGDRYDGIGPFSVSPRNRSEPKRKPVGSIANNAGYSESTTSFLKSNGIENLRKNNSQNYLGTTERSGFLESKGFLGEIRSDSPQKASSSKRLGNDLFYALLFNSIIQYRFSQTGAISKTCQ